MILQKPASEFVFELFTIWLLPQSEQVQTKKKDTQRTISF